MVKTCISKSIHISIIHAYIHTYIHSFIPCQHLHWLAYQPQPFPYRSARVQQPNKVYNQKHNRGKRNIYLPRIFQTFGLISGTFFALTKCRCDFLLLLFIDVSSLFTDATLVANEDASVCLAFLITLAA